jgi:hypothetical protein
VKVGKGLLAGDFRRYPSSSHADAREKLMIEVLWPSREIADSLGHKARRRGGCGTVFSTAIAILAELREARTIDVRSRGAPGIIERKSFATCERVQSRAR